MNLGELAKSIEPSKLKGLKICAIGLLITILGFLLFVAGFETVGRTILYFGMIIGFLGIAVHVYLLFKRV